MRMALIDARKAKGLTVPETAKRLGVSASFYYKIESGKRNPTIALAKLIADILGSDVDTLFFENNLDKTSKGYEVLNSTGTV